MLLPSATPPVKKQIRRATALPDLQKSKIMFPLKMPRATRRAFQIVSLAVTVLLQQLLAGVSGTLEN